MGDGAAQLVLALDCALRATTVALLRDGKIIAQKFQKNEDGQKSRNLLLLITMLLDEAGVGLSDIGRIVYSNGPGGFTSLRIGLATLQGLFWGRSVDAVPVSSLRLRCESLKIRALEQGTDIGCQQNAGDHVIANAVFSRERMRGGMQSMSYIFVMRAGTDLIYAGKLSSSARADIYQEECLSVKDFCAHYLTHDEFLIAGEGLGDWAEKMCHGKIISRDDVVNAQAFAVIAGPSVDESATNQHPVPLTHLKLNYLKAAV